MKSLRALFFCAGAVFLASCTSSLPPLISWARFSPPVAQSFQLNTNTAVVYGRFATEPDFAFGNKLALRLRNENSKQEYLIQCRNKDSVCAFAVEPGRYRVAGFVATFIDHRTVGRRSLPNTPSFDVLSNSVTYLGDFTAYAKIAVIAQEWGVTGLTNNFVATTDELRRKYPNLASVSVLTMFDQPPK